jgi:protein O-GlcNAc transferase
MSLPSGARTVCSLRCTIHLIAAFRLMPRFAAAHSNLGSVLKEQGKLEQALAHYHQAISIDPTFADAYSNMGNAYKDMGRLEDAVRCYLTAIKIRPTFADAYSNLGSTYKDGGQVLEAILCYRRCVVYVHATGYSQIALCVLRALQLKPEFPDAFANLVHSLMFICDWSTRSEDFARLSELIQRQLQVDGHLPSVQPFHALV